MKKFNLLSFFIGYFICLFIGVVFYSSSHKENPEPKEVVYPYQFVITYPDGHVDSVLSAYNVCGDYEVIKVPGVYYNLKEGEYQSVKYIK